MAESMIKTSDREPVFFQKVQYPAGTALTIEPRSYNRLAIASPFWGAKNYSGYGIVHAVVPANATTVHFDLFADGSSNIINNGAPIDINVYLI